MRDKINVLHVTQYLEIGGLETLILELSRNMDRGGVNVTVLCLNGYDPIYKAELEKENISVYLITKNHRFDVLFFRRFVSFLKMKAIDVVHAHGGCFLYSVFCGKLAGVKNTIYTVHGLPIDTSLKARFEDQLSAVMVSRIVPVSREIKENFQSRVFLPAGKIEVIINGIDLTSYKPNGNITEIAALKQRYNIPQGKQIVGSVGRLEKIKNYSMLLRAFAQILAVEGAQLHLVLIGEGREKDRLEGLAEELGIMGHVSFLGMLYDVGKILPIFDIFALSSITEGTSVSLLEAQACGIPSVVTDVGGNGTIVQDGVNGFLCRSNEPLDMADKLSAILENPDLKRRMQANARKQVSEKFDLSVMVRKYQRLYEMND